MREFSFSDLSRKSGDVLDAAMAETVLLIKRGKAKVVMMPKAQYERLLDAQAERTAFTLADAPPQDIENLTAGFEEILTKAERSGQ